MIPPVASLAARCCPVERFMHDSCLGETMKRKQLRFGKGFRVAIDNPRAQAAEMVIAPGDSEGGPKNRHRGSDQWLFVFSGRGCARVNGRRYEIGRASCRERV